MANSHAAPKWKITIEDKFIRISELADDKKKDDSINTFHVFLRNIEGIEKCSEIYQGSTHCALRIHGAFHRIHGSIIYDECTKRDDDYNSILEKIKQNESM